MTLTRILGLTTALLIATSAAAHEFKVGALEIVHPHIPQPAASAMSAAGYLKIANAGPDADQLVGISVGFAKESSLHQSSTDANGVATMTAVPVLDIPPGGSVALEPGGYHIMFMGLTQPLKEGEMVPGTLTFQKAGKVEVQFLIDPPGGAAHDMTNMKGMDMGGASN